MIRFNNHESMQAPIAQRIPSTPRGRRAVLFKTNKPLCGVDTTQDFGLIELSALIQQVQQVQ